MRPLAFSRHTADIFLPSAVAFVSQTWSPITTGVDQAFPVTGVFHTTFFVSLHSMGKPCGAPSSRVG